VSSRESFDAPLQAGSPARPQQGIDINVRRYGKIDQFRIERFAQVSQSSRIQLKLLTRSLCILAATWQLFPDFSAYFS
jgi:hypothetical protein